MRDRLNKITKYLQAGIIDRELIGETIRYSIEKSKESGGEYNPESLTASYFLDKQRPKLLLICATISRQLGSAMAGKLRGDDIKKAGDEMALQVDLWIEETQQQTKPQLTADELKYQKAIDEWNAGNTWKNTSEKINGSGKTWKKFSQAVKRYAERNSLHIRKGSPGTKPKRNE